MENLVVWKMLRKYPKSVREIFFLIEKFDGLMKITELNNLTHYSDRSVRRALEKLFELELVVKVPDFNDLRSHYLISQSKLLTIEATEN